MNIQALSVYCQKNFNQSLLRSGWTENGIYYVKLSLPNGLEARASEEVDLSKPRGPGYYRDHVTQLAVKEAMKVLGIASPSGVSSKNTPSEISFPDTNRGRANFRKCMATAIRDGRFTLRDVNEVLHVPFTSLKDAENLAGQLIFGQNMTPEDIFKVGRLQVNQVGQLYENAGWTKAHGRSVSGN